MEKLIFREAISDSEIEDVLEKIEGYSRVRLPLSYARKSKIVGVFLHEKLVGCYMLVTQPLFRSLLFVPDSIKKSDPFFGKDDYEMMEVNGLWIGPAIKKPSMQLRVWFKLVKDIFLAKKKYVLLMQSDSNQCMKKYLSMANPTTLYQGKPQLLPGDNTHRSIEVSFTTRWSIVVNSYKYLMELRERQRRAAKFEKRRATVISHQQPNSSVEAA